MKENNMENWISVKDRYPDKAEETYLVYSLDDGIGLAYFKHSYETFDCGFFIENAGDHVYYDGILYWMPLPQPPLSQIENLAIKEIEQAVNDLNKKYNGKIKFSFDKSKITVTNIGIKNENNNNI